MSKPGVKRLSPLDAMFLHGETRDTMMHVGSLLPFSPPADTPPEFMRAVMEEVRSITRVEAPWNLKLKSPNLLSNPLQDWVTDEDFDVEYHVRRSALPAPGDERELGILVSRLHSHKIDFSRPPWELHFIEGLEGGRFAIYIKIHHALVDGFTGSKILARSLSRAPSDMDTPMFFTVPEPQRQTASRKKTDPITTDLNGVLKSYTGRAKSVREVGRALLNLSRKPGAEFRHLVSSMQAPRSVLNGKIGRNRRFATQQFSLAQLKRIGKSSGGTLNDVVLAVCAGGLRRFLLELGELPDKPLIAFLPVNIRPKDDEVGGGNAVGAMLASLATDIEDPLDRLAAIVASTRQGKAQMEKMTQGAILAYSAFLMAPFGLQALRAAVGIRGRLPLTFNVCISNVPGPQQDLYFRGARLEASYPLSIPAHGMALNITLSSYGDTLNFGFIGCRDTLPHLQRLAVFSGEALAELESLVK